MREHPHPIPTRFSEAHAAWGTLRAGQKRFVVAAHLALLGVVALPLLALVWLLDEAGASGAMLLWALVVVAYLATLAHFYAELELRSAGVRVDDDEASPPR